MKSLTNRKQQNIKLVRSDEKRLSEKKRERINKRLGPQVNKRLLPPTLDLKISLQLESSLLINDAAMSDKLKKEAIC